MAAYFCPDCWKEIDECTTVCPHCKYDISEYGNLSYEGKLICALRHPIRENRMMAIQLLGEMHSHMALPYFAAILETEEDYFVIREIIYSLERIGNTEGKNIIRRLRTHKSKLVRKIAKQLSSS
jgi:HEAT repeat protein